MSFTFNESHARGRTYVTRDTSVARARTFGYDISPRERGFGLFGRNKLVWTPNNLKFTLQEQSASGTNYTVQRILDDSTGVVSDSLVRRPTAMSEGGAVVARRRRCGRCRS
jgi:hypothetical protein